MYLKRFISNLTGLVSSFWYVATFPFTIVLYYLSHLVSWVGRLFLSIPLVQWASCPRYGTNLVSRFGRVMFTSQGVYSFLGGSLAGLAFLVVYYNVSLVRFDGSYYVQFGGESRVYAEELLTSTVVPEVTPIAVSTLEMPLVTTESVDPEAGAQEKRLVQGQVRAGYKASAKPAPTDAAQNTSALTANVQFGGGFMSPLRNPPRLLLTTLFRSGHPGIDMSTELGTPIYAASSGVVSATGSSIWAYGKVVTIDHGDGWQSMYAHMSRIDVKVGDYVTQATVIGAVGSTGNSTGPHVHFEVHKNGSPVNPRGSVAGL